jgi:hypothetical protein
MRHWVGIVLAIVMAGVLFFAGSWGYLRLLRLPAPLSGLPAGGGSLLSFHGVLAALAAVAATGMLAGILIAAPRISPLAAGLPGLLLIGWTALYLASVRHAVELIPLKSYPSGAGYEAMLFNGILGAAGLAMIIPMFVPSRWRTRNDEAGSEAAAAGEYVSSLARTTESQEPAGSADTVQPVRLSPTAGTLPGRPPWSSLDRPAAIRYPTELGGLLVREQSRPACHYHGSARGLLGRQVLRGAYETMDERYAKADADTQDRTFRPAQSE